MDYQTANNMLQGRCRERRKLENNTYLERRPKGRIAIKLHATDVVTLTPRGNVVLNSGGWRTLTTKARMKSYAPIHLWSESGVWYVRSRENAEVVAYRDGIMISARGHYRGQGDVDTAKRERKAMKNYVRAYVENLMRGKVPAPSAGDCWYCAMSEVSSGQSLGDCLDNSDHITNHIRERYHVPSLLSRAIAEYPTSRIAMSVLYELWENGGPGEYCKSWGSIAAHQFRHSLSRYLARRLALVS